MWLGSNVERQNNITVALHDSAVGALWVPCNFIDRLKPCLPGQEWQRRLSHLFSPVRSVSRRNPSERNTQDYCSLCRCLLPAWQVVSMDFIYGLPSSRRYNHIIIMIFLLVVDKFSKYAHFLPLAHPYPFTGTKLCMSSSYHPQLDVHVERVKQCLETYLRCLVHSSPQQCLETYLRQAGFSRRR